MCLLMMVAICLNATFILEQPFSSYFEFYPRFRELICMLQNIAGPHAVPWQTPLTPLFVPVAYHPMMAP